MDWGGWKRYALVASGVVVALAVFAMLYGWLPWWIDGARLRGLGLKDQAGVLGSDRGDVLKMVAGAGALVALVYTARKHVLDRQAHVLDRQAYALSEQGQVTDRYTKAITQLASDKASERIGGIYALERIMADSARDHSTVVEVLAAFVRQRVPVEIAPECSAGSGGRASDPALPERPDADVQAAMTVLARRPKRDEPFALDLRRTNLARLELPIGARLARANLIGSNLAWASLGSADLTGARLRGTTLTGAFLAETTLTYANLVEATLDRAILNGATLTEAILNGATLAGAILAGATLTEARLVETKLTDAILMGANLDGAMLARANLDGATLVGATMVRANLDGTTLTRSVLLTASQLADAVLTHSTKLDGILAQDEWLLARITACRGWVDGDPIPTRTPCPSETQRADGS